MQTATIMLALGGDQGNTIIKFGVTPAEVAVLREIHGEAAVFDVSPDEEEIERSSREERARLAMDYGKPPGSREMSAVDVLFPGIGARMFETFDELELDESFYKATGREKPKPKAKKARAEVEPEELSEPDEEIEEEPAPAPKKKTAAKGKKKSAIFD